MGWREIGRKVWEGREEEGDVFLNYILFIYF